MYTTNRYAKHLQSAYSNGVWRHAPSRNFLKIRWQKSEFGGISATKVCNLYNLTEVNGPYTYASVQSGF